MSSILPAYVDNTTFLHLEFCEDLIEHRPRICTTEIFYKNFKNLDVIKLRYLFGLSVPKINFLNGK